jgi:hypothetical protein
MSRWMAGLLLAAGYAGQGAPCDEPIHGQEASFSGNSSTGELVHDPRACVPNRKSPALADCELPNFRLDPGRGEMRLRGAPGLLGKERSPGPAPRTALFNGKDLSGFYTWLGSKPDEKEPIGKNKDPLRVFTVQDGMIHISGEVFGYLATEREFENYHLTAEYRWGEKTFAPRTDKARDNGILFHMQGEDKIWPKSIEFQIIEGGTGDALFVGGASMDFDPALESRLADSKAKLLSPDGKRIVTGRINWTKRSPQWKDALGFRGPDDLEVPLGQWNRLDLWCRDGAVEYHVNGVKVFEGRGADPRKGRILLQSEGAEIFFRKLEVNQP